MATHPARTKQSPKIPASILMAAKFLQAISPRLAMHFAARLFTTPLRHKTPKREMGMERKSRQETVAVAAIGKNIVVYHYGNSERKILLVHGWSGRGTQLVKFADELLKLGYSTISFDAPAHGKSPGKTSIMPEFIATILQLEKQFGPFEAAIGHSLGGMSLLNAAQQGLKINRLVAIGSGDIIKEIMDGFIASLELKPEISDMMRAHFEKKSPQTMDRYSAYIAAKEIEIPVLVIHDNNDLEVSVKCAHHIHKHLKNGTLLLTDGLGHRKILGNKNVIEKSLEFIKN